MQCHKHIFSISPKDGVLHDLYSEDIVKYYADCTNVTSILNAIEQMYFDFINGDIEINMAVKSEYRGCSILKHLMIYSNDIIHIFFYSVSII